MVKLKMLIPVNDIEECLYPISWIKKNFTVEEVEITLLNVIENLYNKETLSVMDLENQINAAVNILNISVAALNGYTVRKSISLGIGSIEISKEAKRNSYDLIVISKSNIKGLIRFTGSVTTKVLRDSEVPVLIVPEFQFE